MVKNNLQYIILRFILSVVLFSLGTTTLLAANGEPKTRFWLINLDGEVCIRTWESNNHGWFRNDYISPYVSEFHYWAIATQDAVTGKWAVDSTSYIGTERYVNSNPQNELDLRRTGSNNGVSNSRYNDTEYDFVDGHTIYVTYTVRPRSEWDFDLLEYDDWNIGMRGVYLDAKSDGRLGYYSDDKNAGDGGGYMWTGISDAAGQFFVTCASESGAFDPYKLQLHSKAYPDKVWGYDSDLQWNTAVNLTLQDPTCKVKTFAATRSTWATISKQRYAAPDINTCFKFLVSEPAFAELQENFDYVNGNPKDRGTRHFLIYSTDQTNSSGTNVAGQHLRLNGIGHDWRGNGDDQTLTFERFHDRTKYVFCRYLVVNLDGEVATWYWARHTVGDKPEIPAEIKSFLIPDAGYHYWTHDAFSQDLTQGRLQWRWWDGSRWWNDGVQDDTAPLGKFTRTGSTELTEIPAGGCDIYVTYEPYQNDLVINTNSSLGATTLRIDGTATYSLQHRNWNNRYVSAPISDNLLYGTDANRPDQGMTEYTLINNDEFHFTLKSGANGTDPYNIQIISLADGQRRFVYADAPTATSANNLVTYVADSATWAAASTPIKSFILLEGSTENINSRSFKQIELAAAYNAGTCGLDAWRYFSRIPFFMGAIQNYRTRVQVNEWNARKHVGHEGNNQIRLNDITSNSVTYHILDLQGHEAIRYSVRQERGLPLNYDNIPIIIRSPLLKNQALVFHKSAPPVSSKDDNDHKRTIYNLSDATFNDAPNIATTLTDDIDHLWITYSYDNTLSPIDLTGNKEYYINMTACGYLTMGRFENTYTSAFVGNWNGLWNGFSTTPQATTYPSFAEYSTYPNMLFTFEGEDPYRMIIKNKGYLSTNRIISNGQNNTLYVNETDKSRYDTYTLLYDNDGNQRFVATVRDNNTGNGNSDEGATVRYFIWHHQRVNNETQTYLRDGFDSQYANEYTNVQIENAVTYYVVNLNHKLSIRGRGTAGTKESPVTLSMPQNILSPLMQQSDFKYYLLSQFDETELAAGNYILKAGEEANNITSSTQLDDTQTVYAIYSYDYKGKAVLLNGIAEYNILTPDQNGTRRYWYVQTDANNTDVPIHGNPNLDTRKGNRYRWTLTNANGVPDPYDIQIVSKERNKYITANWTKPIAYNTTVLAVNSNASAPTQSFVLLRRANTTDEDKQYVLAAANILNNRTDVQNVWQGDQLYVENEFNNKNYLTTYRANGYHLMTVQFESVGEYTFHLTTKISHREITESVTGLAGQEIQLDYLSYNILRRFTDYTFYLDPEHTQQITTFPDITEHSDIYVDYSDHVYTDNNGLEYKYFSSDVAHAYWFAGLYKPWDHNCFWKVGVYDTDPTAFYQYNEYNDGTFLKDSPLDRAENAKLAFAFLGDAYDATIINYQWGDSRVLSVVDDDPAVNSVLGFYPQGDKPYQTFEFYINGTASSNKTITNTSTTIIPVGTELQFNSWWASPLRIPLASFNGTSFASCQLIYIPDRADVVLNFYDITTGNDEAELAHAVDATGDNKIFKAGQDITQLPDSLIIPGLKYTYYPTLADLKASTNGVDNLANLGLKAVRPNHDAASASTDDTLRVWIAYEITDEYPITFANDPALPPIWYFIAQQDDTKEYGWTRADHDANDNFVDLLYQFNNNMSWNRTISADHTLNGGLNYLEVCDTISAQADKTRKPHRLLWKFVGNPYGFRIINREAGDTKTLRINSIADNQNILLADYNADEASYNLWRLQKTRRTEAIIRTGSTAEKEELPHFSFRLASSPNLSIIGEKNATRVRSWNTGIDVATTHQYCTRLYKYEHKTYFNVHAHLKNLDTGSELQLDIPWDTYDFYLERTITKSKLPESVRRAFTHYEHLYSDAAFTQEIDDITGITYIMHPELYMDSEGNPLQKEDYWDYDADQVDDDKAALIWVDLYLTYRVDDDAPVKFFANADELTDPASQNKWYFLQMGISEGTNLGNYYSTTGLTIAEQTFLDRSNARCLNFLTRNGGMSNADYYGNQTPTYGDETVNVLGGNRYFHSQNTIKNINLLSPHNDFRRIAETFMDGTDANFRESRWLWGFIGDPYGFEIVNRETINKRLAADIKEHTTKWNAETKTYDPVTNTYPIRLTSAYTTNESNYKWEMAVPDGAANNEFCIKALDEDKYLCSKEKNNPELTWQPYADVDARVRTVKVYPWNWSDSKYKHVTVHIYRDAVNGTPVLTREFTPADRMFMAGDVLDGSEHHFYLPHEGDDNYNAAIVDGHLIDIPYELKRRFCTYEIEGGSFTVQDTDDEQTLNIIYHVQEPDADNPYIPRFLKEEDLASFRAANEIGDFTNSEGVTLPKSDYYYFLDIGNTLSHHAFINPDPARGTVNRHPYDVVDNRFGRSNPTQLQWFFVGDPYALRIFNVYITNNTSEAYRGKEFNLARNYHRNNEAGEYGDAETDFNIVYMEEVTQTDNPQAPHGRVYWEMVEPRRNASTGHYYKENDTNVKYRFDRIKDLPFALRITKPHFYDYPDEATASAHPDDDTYKTRLGRGTAFYLTSTANGNGMSSSPYNYNTWGNALYHYRNGKTNPRGNELEASVMTFPDLRYKANRNPDGSNLSTNPSSLFTAMPVGRVYVTVFDHEDISTKVTDYELSDYYAITERFKGVPANLQREYCDYTRISTHEDMSDNIVGTDGYVEVTDGTAHLYATYQETANSPFSAISGEDIVLTDAQGQPTEMTTNTWYNMSVNGNWAFFNSNFRGFDYETATENSTRVDVMSKYSGNINASSATAADDWRFRKGLSWALIGDPYHFVLRNKRDQIVGQGSKIDGEYESYTSTPAYLVERADHTAVEMGKQAEAASWTLIRNAAANISDASAVYFLSQSEERRTEACGPINGNYMSAVYSIADHTRNIRNRNNAAAITEEASPTNYDLGDQVRLVPAEYVEYDDGTNNGGAGNEGFDAIVNVYNRLSEIVATTGWTELSRKRSEWNLDNNLPADVRRWSCTYHLWADPTMTALPFNSYRDRDESGEYLIKDGGIVYVTYDYDEAIFSSENEYRWVNPFFNWDDKKKTWPLHHREVYKYTAEQYDYSVSEGGTTHRYILPEANIRTQEVDLFNDASVPTIPYRDTKEGWLESPSSASVTDPSSPYYGFDTKRAYAFSDHQYKSQERYVKDGQWDGFTDAEKAERADEDMKVQKWALIGDPYKFILYNYYRRNDAFNEDKNAYYLQYKDGQIINAELPEADREVAEGEAPTEGYTREQLQGVYWTWKVDGTGYEYKKRKPTATTQDVETADMDYSEEETGSCSVKLRNTFYETDDAGNSTGILKTGYLAVCDLTANSLYNKTQLIGSIVGYATFARQREDIIELDGHTHTGDSFDFLLYQTDSEYPGTYSSKNYSVTNGSATPRIGAAYTKGFNDKYKGYIYYDGNHIAQTAENGAVAITRDLEHSGVYDYERDYYTSQIADGVEQNQQYTNFAEWRLRYGTTTYDYIHYEGTPGGEYQEGVTRTGTYYTGGEGYSLPQYIIGYSIDRDGHVADKATQGVEPEEEIITYKKIQVLTGVSDDVQYLTLTGGPSDVENRPTLGNAYRFLVTTMPIHAASITFHLDPEDHGQENGGRTSQRDFSSDPIYDYTSEDYGIGNDLMLPWLMRRQYCNYTYYLEHIEDIFDAAHVDDLQYVTGAFNTGRLAERNSDYNSFWTANITTPLIVSASGSIEVPDEWEDKHIYIRVTYEPDHTRWQSSTWTNNKPDEVYWFNLATQAAEGLPPYFMQYTRSQLVRGQNHDQKRHATNDYLWAVEGDPYGFVLHNRYAAHYYNGQTSDGGTTWPQVNERWNTAMLTTDYVNSHEYHNYDATNHIGGFTNIPIVDDQGDTTGYKTAYQADVIFSNQQANTKLRMIEDAAYEDANITATPHTPDAYALYEGMTGNYSLAMMIHPVKAPINTRDENGIKYYTSYIFNGVNWPVQLNYMQEWQAMRNVYCNWVLTLPSAAQLLPYWQRAGMTLALTPAAADTKRSVELYTSADNYTDKILTSTEVDLYSCLLALAYSDNSNPLFDQTKTFGIANASQVLRAARQVVHNPKNLVNFSAEGSFIRLLAYSSVTDSLRGGLMTRRYASVALHQQEAAASLPIHFYATHYAGRTFNDLTYDAAETYGQGNATNFSREQLGLPKTDRAGIANAYNATRGHIPVEAVTFDPSSVFLLSSNAADAHAHRFWTMRAQSIQPGEGLSLSDTVALLGGTPAQFDIQDIGATAVQIQTREHYESKHPDAVTRETEGRDYLSYSTEKAFYALKRGTELATSADSLRHTRWMLEPVADEEPNSEHFDYAHPLRLRVYEDMHTGGKYCYGSLYMPFDVQLQTGAVAYIPELVKSTTVDGETEWYVTTKLINRKTNTKKGNNFVPAGTAVVVRVPMHEVESLIDETGVEQKFITMTLPNVHPSLGITNEIITSTDGTMGIGAMLEQELVYNQTENNQSLLAKGPQSDQILYVFGQYQLSNGEYTPVGFYRNINHNWYADPDFDDLENQWYRRDDPTDWQRNNLYVRHNRLYITYPHLPNGPAYINHKNNAEGVIPIHFDGDDTDPSIEQSANSSLDDAWYTPIGQRLSESPTMPGVYLHGGKRVIVLDYSGNMLFEK